MGHVSIHTTVDFCGRLVSSSNRSVVYRLDDVDEMQLNVVAAEAV